MLIEFKGPYFESWDYGGHKWETVKDTHKEPREQEVSDPETVATLLTQPGNLFVVSKNEPLLTLEGVGPVMAANLANAGYGSQDALAGALVADQKELAASLGVDADVVKGWVTTSKEAVKARQSAATGATAGATGSAGTTAATPSNIASGPVGPASGPLTTPGEGPATTGGLAGTTTVPSQ